MSLQGVIGIYTSSDEVYNTLAQQANELNYRPRREIISPYDEKIDPTIRVASKGTRKPKEYEGNAAYMFFVGEKKRLEQLAQQST